MNSQIYEIDKCIENAYNQAEQAAKARNVSELQRISQMIKELEILGDKEAAIQKRKTELIAGLNGDLKDVPTVLGNTSISTAIFELPIMVTEGMVKQHYLALTPHIKRGKVKIGEEMKIRSLPSDEIFSTVILEKGNKLQERGAVRRFFEDAEVSDGDYVVLTKDASGQWSLKKAAEGKYGPSMKRILDQYN